MTRRSSCLWRAARSNDFELPNPPVGMSDPAWACLVYFAQCQFCDAAGVPDIDWMFRLRICRKCVPVVTIRMGDALKIIDGDPKVAKRLGELSRDPSLPYRASKHGIKLCLITDVAKLVSEVFAIHDPDEYQAYVQTHKLIQQENLALQARCVDWQRRTMEFRRADQRILRAQREEGIREKLTELGWEAELAVVPDANHQDLALAKHRLVWKAQALTDKVWQHIKGPLVELMQQIRKYRIKLEMANITAQRQDVPIEVLHSFNGQICHIPISYQILSNSANSQPSKTSSSSRQNLTSWNESKFEDLREVLRRDTDVEEPNLELASSVFLCRCPPSLHVSKNYPHVSFFPEILSHSCLTTQKLKRSIYRINNDFNPLKALFCYEFHERRPWSIETLSGNRTVKPGIHDIIKASGLDPASASLDMDKLDCYFVCLTCTELCDSLQRIGLYNWRRAVGHIAENHCNSSYYHHGWAEWRTVSAENASEVVASSRYDGSESLRIWNCLHCLNSPVEQPQQCLTLMQEHIRDMHQVSDPMDNQNYFRHFPRFSSVSNDRYIVSMSAYDMLLGNP
ncbi:hypothetical protein C8J56DRAFT_1158270 [Mycena floridula]|nr:hypothetical protein C8J56DRAFT_1158270 [Mycena floridula]